MISISELLAGFKDMEEIYVNGDLEHRVGQRAAHDLLIGPARAMHHGDRAVGAHASSRASRPLSERALVSGSC